VTDQQRKGASEEKANNICGRIRSNSRRRYPAYWNAREEKEKRTPRRKANPSDDHHLVQYKYNLERALEALRSVGRSTEEILAADTPPGQRAHLQGRGCEEVRVALKHLSFADMEAENLEEGPNEGQIVFLRRTENEAYEVALDFLVGLGCPAPDSGRDRHTLLDALVDVLPQVDAAFVRAGIGGPDADLEDDLMEFADEFAPGGDELVLESVQKEKANPRANPFGALAAAATAGHLILPHTAISAVVHAIQSNPAREGAYAAVALDGGPQSGGGHLLLVVDAQGQVLDRWDVFNRGDLNAFDLRYSGVPVLGPFITPALEVRALRRGPR